MKTCKFCNTEVPKRAKYCPNCRKRIKPRTGLIVTLIFFVLFFGGLGVGMQEMMKNPEKYNTSTVAKAVGENNMEIESVLESCGITNIKSMTHDELLDNAHFDGEKGYRLTDEHADNIIVYLNADNEVFTIKYADYVLYSDGTVQGNIGDYTFTLDEITNWQVKCQDKIKELLKAPSTAKFPNFTEWGWQKEKNIVTIQGYVDAENAFGATLRSEFQFIIDSDTNTIQSLIFDGQEMIK